MSKKLREPFRLDDDRAYRELVYEAETTFPNDLMGKLAYVKDRGTVQQYLHFLCSQTQTQTNLSSISSRHWLEMNYGELDMMFRSLVAAINSVTPHDNEVVMTYINSKLESVALRICEESLKVRQ